MYVLPLNSYKLTGVEYVTQTHTLLEIHPFFVMGINENGSKMRRLE